MEFSGKRALVTGGSRGIGAEICRTLAHLGADVAVNYVEDAGGKTVRTPMGLPPRSPGTVSEPACSRRM